ncbi:ABC transporter ATP-binding protein [Dysgonomonas sp. ZJ279]|uniref:ABC transporter ATP-binding protein n=1 Tax=Dysgonomonas sp. ZJ279 TaxID=2709796 RepID=UPI0013EC5A53|nr:ABC transporter ATP-binding protein [Dysgonomonas sp. ZJ279]
MSDIAIKFENISKQYRLGTIGTGTISHDLNRWWHVVRGKEDPYLKIGEVNDRSSKATSDYVWALRDISFEVKQGEVLGIIGKNGAGKSTLLKILSRVTSPTTGTIKAKGRIASLLEVGTGFHPEMTGRENIYMNGSIMGMTKAEITRKLDEIVDFAGIEKYIDTPTKRYSSGMTVRLGFAIAAHLEPEILVVDEVLAVGDAEFQKKAIGKMQDVSKGEGRTVLFVSHNLEAVRELCSKCILLTSGSVAFSGETDDVLNEYIRLSNEDKAGEILVKKDNFTFLGFNNNENSLRNLKIDDDINLELKFQTKEDWKNVFIDISIRNKKEQMIIDNKAKFISQGIDFKAGETSIVSYTVKKPYLAPGDYYITLYIYNKDGRIYWHELIPLLTINSTNTYDNAQTILLDDVKGIILPNFKIEKT